MAMVLLIGFGWLIWKAPPPVRVSAAILLVGITAYTASNLAKIRERNRIHTTYFRGLSMAFCELDHLAKTNDVVELTTKLSVLNQDFSNTTSDERAFNALMMKILNPSRTWTDR